MRKSEKKFNSMQKLTEHKTVNNRKNKLKPVKLGFYI